MSIFLSKGLVPGTSCAGSVRFLSRTSQEAPEETEGVPPSLPGFPTSPPHQPTTPHASQESAPQPGAGIPHHEEDPPGPPPVGPAPSPELSPTVLLRSPPAPRSPPPSRISATVLARRRGAPPRPPAPVPAPSPRSSPGLTSEGAEPGPDPRGSEPASPRPSPAARPASQRPGAVPRPVRVRGSGRLRGAKPRALTPRLDTWRGAAPTRLGRRHPRTPHLLLASSCATPPPPPRPQPGCRPGPPRLFPGPQPAPRLHLLPRDRRRHRPITAKGRSPRPRLLPPSSVPTNGQGVRGRGLPVT